MFDLLNDLWHFMRERKKLWLAPVIVLLVLVGLFVGRVRICGDRVEPGLQARLCFPLAGPLH